MADYTITVDDMQVLDMLKVFEELVRLYTGKPEIQFTDLLSYSASVRAELIQTLQNINSEIQRMKQTEEHKASLVINIEPLNIV